MNSQPAPKAESESLQEDPRTSPRKVLEFIGGIVLMLAFFTAAAYYFGVFGKRDTIQLEISARQEFVSDCLQSAMDESTCKCIYDEGVNMYSETGFSKIVHNENATAEMDKVSAKCSAEYVLKNY